MTRCVRAPQRLLPTFCLFVKAAVIALLLGAATPALAWWDTVLTTVRPVPLVQEFEAETLTSGTGLTAVADAQANGGRGGQAVQLETNGKPLQVKVEIKQPGVYALFVIARGSNDQWGRTILQFTARHEQSQQANTWTMLAAYRERYAAAGTLYFPADAAGTYTLSVQLVDRMPPSATREKWLHHLIDPQTLMLAKDTPTAPLLVDRLELRDALGNCPGVAVKTQRTLTSDAQLARLRADFAAEYPQRKDQRLPMGTGHIKLSDLSARDAAGRRARAEELWAQTPDFNMHVTHSSAHPYGVIIGRDRTGQIADAASIYQLAGNTEAAWDGAVLLCAVAWRWPGVDYHAQGVGKFTNIDTGAQAFGFSQPTGKNVYRGWAGRDTERLVTSYDQLFDYIKDNQELADFLHTRIAWIKTPADVRKLLDVYLLQSSWDNANRDYISGGDSVKALIPLVQGVSPVSDRMLDEGLFTKMNMNMTFAGGIDDQAICSYNRDGVHYIGSTGYVGNDLQEIAELLHRYRSAGGAARYDLLDEQLYPHMAQSMATVQGLRAAGGFAIIVGDAMDLRRTREADIPAQPSRVLGGFGQTVLENNQFQANPLNMNAAAIHFGIGRGHAHQDTLNLELFAHGARMAPDLGGRHEGKNTGSPNMRWNKVHNLVEVDQRNFENSYPGSTVSGTGWNTGFAPLPGAQYMAHAARATSHPDVSTYARQTTLISVDQRNSYVFDVFRVAGGSTHTYCFHGVPTEQLKVNADLHDASSAQAVEYLRKHYDGTRKEGVTPALLEADWSMNPGLQKAYQGAGFEPDRPAVTRLSLFGQQGQLLMIGNAYSEAYNYNFPFLYVQGHQDGGAKQSVYPAVIEMYAGTPFIASKAQLPISNAGSDAAAAVALQVDLPQGQQDVLYASAAPQTAQQVAGKHPMQVAGRMALVRRDGDGVALAQLVGGATLKAADVEILLPQASYVGQVQRVDYPQRSLTVAGAWPTRLLRGAVVGIGPDEAGIRHNFTLTGLSSSGQSTTLTHRKTARFYRSTIAGLHADAQEITCEIEPPVFGPDTQYINGTTVSNESLTRTWRVNLREGDRWMHFGFPGYRTSQPIKLTLDDVPDTNGDGRRTLTMLARADEKNPGAELLTLEVTRLSADGSTLFFKLPTEENYQRGGWQFAYRPLRDEAGRTVLNAWYPGSTFAWQLQGNFTAQDFTDADGDGKVKLTAYLYGPGDQVFVDAAVQIRRTAPGTYAVQSNSPCTLRLKGVKGQQAEVSADGKAWQAVKAQTQGDWLQVDLTEAALADGNVTLRVK